MKKSGYRINMIKFFFLFFFFFLATGKFIIHQHVESLGVETLFMVFFSFLLLFNYRGGFSWSGVEGWGEKAYNCKSFSLVHILEYL